MKATGIVRRVDDLGRIVIPREIRRSVHIEEGTPLELFLDGDVICFQKYNTRGNIIEEIQNFKDYIRDEITDDDINIGLRSILLNKIHDIENIINDYKK